MRAGGADVFFVQLVVLRRLRFQQLATGVVIRAQIFFRLLQFFGLGRELLRFRLRGGKLGADNVQGGFQVFRGILRVAQGREDLLFRFFRSVLQRLPYLAHVPNFQTKLLRLGKTAFAEFRKIF